MYYLNTKYLIKFVSITLGLILIPLTGFAGNSISTKLFDPGYLEGDCNYHSLTAASDGMIYFTVCTHHKDLSARIYRFNPSDETMEQIGDLGEIFNTDVQKEIPHGKIHTALTEHNGYLYFSTHTSYYDVNLPNIVPDDGRTPYQGGHFIRYNLQTGIFEDLVQVNLPSNGLITMSLDKTSDTLYGITWPSGFLISYNLEEGLVHNWGAVQQGGEWGQLGSEWNFICRKLGIDDKGAVYGSTDTGRIWRFDSEEQRPLTYYKNLNVAQVAPVQEEAFVIEARTHFFWRNWRTILWNPDTESFWGIQGGSTQLFEFKPSTGLLRSVHSLRADGVPKDTRRTMYKSQLGFMLGPNNTLLYLAHAPGVKAEGRAELETSVHLITYQIDTGVFEDHGILTTPDGRRIFFTESVTVGQDGHIYTVAWVESIDPDQRIKIQSARHEGVPVETEDNIYEIQLVQLPTWQALMD